MYCIQDQMIVDDFYKDIEENYNDYSNYNPSQHRFFKDFKRNTDKMFQYARKVTGKGSFDEQLEQFAQIREQNEN